MPSLLELLALGALLCAAGCGPSLTDTPTAYEGTDELAIAVLCGDEAVEVGGKTWAKFATKYAQGVQPDWKGETLEVQGGVLTRRAAGRPTTQEDGSIRRIETFWVEPPPDAKPGDRVRIGPLRFQYARANGGSRSASHDGCEMRVEE
jgi:hypothetical protein